MTYDNHALNHIKRAMKLIPKNARGAAVMRHAERDEIPPGEHGNEVMLTLQGKHDAVAAGRLMKGRIARLLHSPVPRCLQTAEHLRQGGDSQLRTEEWLGLRCDVYAPDIESANSTLMRLSSGDGFYDEFIEHMSTCGENIPYENFSPPHPATVQLMQGIIGSEKYGLCVGITHDWLVNVAVSYATGKVVSRADNDYTEYLDALFIWEFVDSWMFYHKGRSGKCPHSFSKYLM